MITYRPGCYFTSALLNSGMILGRSPTSELGSSSGNQGFNEEVGDLGCLSITSNQSCPFISVVGILLEQVDRLSIHANLWV